VGERNGAGLLPPVAAAAAARARLPRQRGHHLSFSPPYLMQSTTHSAAPAFRAAAAGTGTGTACKREQARGMCA